MRDYADLEIGLHRRDGTTWRVELRYNQPLTDADTRLDIEGPLVTAIDPAALHQLRDDEEAYGRRLGAALLDGPVEEAYRVAVATSQTQGVTLRVRLLVGPSAAALHGVRWETMRDPRDGSPLLTDENIVFSRYLSSLDWRRVGLSPKSSLRALVVVAGPDNAGEYGDRELAAVDVAGEEERARAGLDPVPTRVLTGPDATEERLFAELHEGCDVLYLVCHGYRVGAGESVLLLSDADGRAAPVTGSTLVERIRDLARTPRLIVLASCQSAGTDGESRSADGGVLAALGPRLAEAGVPAVLAMQGDVSMATIARFMPVFFRELQRDGQVDRAVAAARSAVRDRDDWWVPALFMRLRSGRIWYTPGFSGSGADGFEKFPALVNDIRRRKCTPILGPGMSDQLLGSRQRLAQRWAKNFRFPMAPQLRDDLPQVAQYLSVNLSRQFPRDELSRYLRAELLAAFDDELGDHVRGQHPDEVSLRTLMSEAWRVRHAAGQSDPYAILASLPLPLYVTTQPWNLLAEALRAVGRSPQVDTYRWKRLDGDTGWDEPDDEQDDDPEWAFHVDPDPERRRAAAEAGWPPPVLTRDGAYRPSEAEPLVYHLFGHIARPRSLVLTEDDYFDFLIGVTRDRDLVPSRVRRAFADSSLLFLGFRLDEWDFRVLHRTVLSQEGNRSDSYTNVAVQIDPEEGRNVEPERARRYLERYFDSSNITIYWGSTESFIKELGDAWAARS
jgi:CHAT domain/SIR2-like domain